MNKFKKWVLNPTIFIIKIYIIVSLLQLTYNFVNSENNTGAIIFAGFSLFFILFFFGSNFEIVELLGAKFKLKELNTSINELKELSKTIAKISLDTVQSQRRLGSPDKKIQQDFFNEIDKILDNVNISEDEKEEIYNKYWHSWIIWDYFSHIKSLIREALTNNNGNWPEFDTLFREKSEHIKRENHNSKFLTEMLNWSKENLKADYDWSKIEEYIADFDFYIQNKTFKKFHNWLVLFKQGEE